MSEYYIGQVFEEIYPPEAAEWCNQRGDAYIVEITKDPRKFEIKLVPLPPLEDVKSAKLEEIKRDFTEEIEEKAHIVSSIDNFEIDARRVDLQNIDVMITYYNTPIIYVGYSTTRANTTLEDLRKFKEEIATHGMGLYQRKWELEKLVANATTIDEVNNIHWDKHRD